MIMNGLSLKVLEQTKNILFWSVIETDRINRCGTLLILTLTIDLWHYLQEWILFSHDRRLLGDVD